MGIQTRSMHMGRINGQNKMVARKGLKRYKDQFCSIEPAKGAKRGCKRNGAQEEIGRDCGDGTGDQWEGKQNKFMLRRGGNLRCGSGKRDMETKEEAAKARGGRSLGGGWTLWGKHTNL